VQARHLSILCLHPAPTQEVFDYLDTLFPCSRIVVNLRRDRRAQARALVSSFFDAEDSLAESTPPLTLVERDVERVSQFLLEWHQNKSSTGRSFLMYTEDMTAERFTQLAQWLGRPCNFGSVPNANEFDAGQKRGKERFHSSDVPVNVTCTSETSEKSSNVTNSTAVNDAGPDAPQKHTSSYRALMQSHDDQCAAVEVLPHSQACASAELAEDTTTELKIERPWKLARSTPKFYIHEDGPFDLTDSVDCLMDSVGLNKDVDSFDDHLTPDTAEHLTDWWLLEQFRRHPSRVNSPDDAQLHVVGTPFTTAYRAHRTLSLARGSPSPYTCTTCTCRPATYTLPHLTTHVRSVRQMPSAPHSEC